MWAQNTEGHFLRYRRKAANTLGDVTDTKILENHVQNLKNVSLFPELLIYMNATIKECT